MNFLKIKDDIGKIKVSAVLLKSFLYESNSWKTIFRCCIIYLSILWGAIKLVINNTNDMSEKLSKRG